MNKFLSFISLFVFFNCGRAQLQTRGNKTPTYYELISEYQRLDSLYPEIELYTIGKSDCDLPLYVCILNGENDSIKTFEKAKSGSTILINNAIHAGEPDGVNASLELIYRFLKKKRIMKSYPLIAIIPAYNVGGMLNRSSSSRANQNGPDEYGFRGNAQNFDLNRDFMKMDAENTWSFVKLYQALDPDVFIDTHVSNGSDYQYTLTLISPMQSRLHPTMKKVVYDSLIPELSYKLKSKEIEFVPYVESIGETPESGISEFNDLPRYAQGYAGLNHAISFTVETHMLKPFDDRVNCTFLFLCAIIELTKDYSKSIEFAKTTSIEYSKQRTYFPFSYSLSSDSDSIFFKGFKSENIDSKVSNGSRLFYDRSKPFEKNISYFKYGKALDSIQIPSFYLIPTNATKMIDRLRINGVEMFKYLPSKDSIIGIQIVDFKSSTAPYEGHYLHRKVTSFEKPSGLAEGISYYAINTNQKQIDLIIHSLEPRCEDSFFAWNFMDSYIQQKEYYSAYVFEDKAGELLKNDAKLKQRFEEMLNSNEEFAKSPEAQLDFMYKNSPYFENKTYYLLPVLKVY